MDDRLNEIRKREQAASPGPWKKETVDLALETAKTVGIVFVIHSGSQWDKDTDFIAHAREDIPWLLDLVAELRARLDKYETDTSTWIIHAQRPGFPQPPACDNPEEPVAGTA